MRIKSKQDYLKSLEGRDLKLYWQGQQVTDAPNHPMIRPSVNAVAMTYALAEDPQLEDLMTAVSPLTGKRVNRFLHIFQSTEDLEKKVRMQRLLGQMTGSCFQRCVGMDAINALHSVTYELDQESGTSYHERFVAYLKDAQERNIVIDGAMMDPKGDRSRTPSQQSDPDMYLRIVEETAGGIVVRGAKAHQTGCINSHEIIVMPAVAMKADDQDYAVSFALPVETKGITYVYGRQPSDTRRMEEGLCGELDRGHRFCGQEIFVIFDDVFVPWERVFMCREYQYAFTLVERFAAYHRQSYACKAGVGDTVIGAAALIAQYNGVEKASHIRDKIVEMIHLNETIWCCALACSREGKETASGNYLVDPLLANVSKQNVTRFPYEIARLLQDIAGGIMVTLPSAKDFTSPEVGHHLQKYLKGVDGVPTEDRFRLLRFIEHMTLGSGAVAYLTESMHGAGSPQAQRIMIARLFDVEARKEMAKSLAGITN